MSRACSSFEPRAPTYMKFAHIKKRPRCSMKEMHWAVRFGAQWLFYEDDQSRLRIASGPNEGADLQLLALRM